jgi:SAM-dependent methyltransferase
MLVSQETLKFTDANKIAWEQTAAEHEKSQFDRLCQKFAQGNYNYLGEIETQAFQNLGLQGKSVVQLACNNGRELISIKNLGAERVVGFDISEPFIQQGHKLAELAKVDAELIASDVYQIPSSYYQQFDIAFISVGALMLMPNLQELMALIGKLLRQDAHIFIYERHPMLDMFHWSDQNDPPVIIDSYFRETERRVDKVCNYWTKEEYSCSPMYLFHHKLSDIFQALLQNGFEILDFQEYEHDISEVFVAFEKLTLKPALSYSLLAKRK